MSEKETVKVTVTVEMPKNVHKLLEGFAAFVNLSLEELLKRELETDIPNFYQSETFVTNIETAVRNHGCAEYFRLPKQSDC